MTTLVFEMADINKLIEEIRTAKRFRSPQIRSMTRHAIRGALLNAEGQTEEEARKAGRVFFPSSSKLPAHIWCQSASRAQSWCIPDH